MTARAWPGAVLIVIAIAGCDAIGPSKRGGLPAYDVIDLDALIAVEAAEIAGVNDQLQVIGQRPVDGRKRGFIWEDGVLSELPCLPKAINSKGQVGCAIPSDTGDLPAMWDNGTVTQLMPQVGSVTHISDSGHVVGITRITNGGGGFSVVYRWRAGVLQIGYVATGSGRPNNNGDVPFTPGSILYPKAMVWYAAGGLSNTFGTWHRYSYAYAINDGGAVAGSGERVPGTRAFVAQKTTGEFRADSIGPSDARGAVDINNAGFVIGTSDGGPFLWQAGVYRTVAQLLTTSEWSVTQVIALTPGVRILARANRAGRHSLVVLEPRR